RGAAGHAQVHAVVQRFIAPIERTVDVVHPSVALVHILVGEGEHVIVEPVRAHGLVPVAGHFGDAATVVGSAGAIIGSAGVDGGETGQHPRIVVIIKLVRPEISAGETVVFRAVMSVVLVGGQGEASEAAV